MSQYKKTDEIFIVTKKLGYIPQLKTSGPIPNPIKVPVELCLEMVIAGIQLFQFQVGTGKLAELTIDNIYDVDKFDDKVEEDAAPDTLPVDEVITETKVEGVQLNPVDAETSDDAVVTDAGVKVEDTDSSAVVTEDAEDAKAETSDDAVVTDAGVKVEDTDSSAVVTEDAVDTKEAAPVVQTTNTSNKNSNKNGNKNK